MTGSPRCTLPARGGIGRDPTGLRPGGTLAATGFPAGPVEGDVFEVLDRMHERVGTLRRDDAPDTVVPVAESAGFELVARIDEPGRPVGPRSEADLIE
ncbi:MAG TPA: hypothetical protein VNC80_10010, partial [Mycobacteriales bacterium]|nr:hypothetical protein [Mycobacteriales bacterium]